ncbi:MAG: HupE/UreJ family protein [Gammaproteobacteria bacterium]|nr:HupE/UreJ family protein [Gammaproteobacteria bacterium]
MKHLPSTACTIIALFAIGFAEAHEIRPGLLEVEEVASDLDGTAWFRTSWKLPRTGYATLKLAPAFSSSCQYIQDPLPEALLAAFRFAGTLECAPGLEGTTITVDGLQATLTDTLLRVRFADGEEFQALLNASNPSARIPEARSIGLPACFTLGVTHMLYGIDHLLFVLGLILLILGGPQDARSPRQRILSRVGVLTATVTSFTLAHSITLALAVLDLVTLSQGPVETVIALSIVLLACEIARDPKRQGLVARRPWQVAFVFGLLHGFGFAGALAEIGLPQESLAVALLLFNLGVEAGQLGVIGCVLIAFAAFASLLSRLPKFIHAAPVYAVGIIACYWTLDRVQQFM